MPNLNTVKKIALASLLVTATLMAQTPYDEGQKALRDQRWTEAADQFERAISSDQDQAGSATYWRAYALFKAGRNSEAERELRRLERKYPESRWVKEGQALRIEHQDSSRSIEQVESGDSIMDEELRLFALAQLMERNPERAMPLLKDLVNTSDSPQVRRDALFVLAMSEDPQALEMLADAARNSDDPDLQVNAIHILGAASSEQSLTLLKDLNTEQAPFEVKQAIIQAYISSDQPEPLLTLFKSETNPELQRQIIHSLGAMDATEELNQLYASIPAGEQRLAVIEAYSIAGESARLKQILETETDPDIRRAALHGIAMDDDRDTPEYLGALYERAETTDEKRDILSALIMLDGADELAMKIIRTEKDPELQQHAIHILGVMDSNEHLAELYRSLDDRESRRAVMEAMAIAGDSDALAQILQSEQDEELRIAAIQNLAIADGDATGEQLTSMYSNGSRAEKSAIIQSMLIMDDSELLISLLKQEDDPDLKRQMLQMLTLMGSEDTDQYLFDLLEEEG